CCATCTTFPTRRSPPSWGFQKQTRRSGCTGPVASCGRRCTRCEERTRPMPSDTANHTSLASLTCEEIAGALADYAEGVDTAPRDIRSHVETCLRCQAELVQYRRLLKGLHNLRTEVLEPAPGHLTSVLAHIEAVGERGAI